MASAAVQLPHVAGGRDNGVPMPNRTEFNPGPDKHNPNSRPTSGVKLPPLGQEDDGGFMGDPSGQLEAFGFYKCALSVDTLILLLCVQVEAIADKYLICTQTLVEGYVQSFVDFFYLTHSKAFHLRF